MQTTPQAALKAIQKKLVGKRLSYKEIYAVMDEIANDRLGDILTTYFAAAGYSRGFTYDEIYHLTKAMIETGDKLHFKGIIADKHSIGGLPGTRCTMIIVPIIAACGFTIPKSSSRAITTPAGTADCMEVISKVTFTEEEIYKIVEKTKGCIVWGGGFKIAPADDEIIHVEEPLLLESYDKILVSVMAKKVAFGSNHIVIDIPYGKTMKVHIKEDAQNLGNKFKYLARKFDLELEVIASHSVEPAGNGIGPLLEAKDALKVLEQTSDRPLDLENRSLSLASALLEICLKDAEGEIKDYYKTNFKSTEEWAKEILTSGKAHKKMLEIIEAQKGDSSVTSEKLKAGSFIKEINSDKSGEVMHINSKNITIISKILGAPQDKKSGLLLHKRVGDKVQNHEDLFTLFSENEHKLSEAKDSLEMFPIYDIES
jgi:AMP phosphorylase